MKQQIGLGSLVGVVVGLLCWRGNHEPQLVSTFPDGVTLAGLALLLAVAIRFLLRRQRTTGWAATFRVSMGVAMATGVVFGSIVACLGLLRFSRPSPVLLVFGFLTAFGSSLVCGAITALTKTVARVEQAA